MGPVVAADGGGFPTEGYAKRDFEIRTGAEDTGIRKVWTGRGISRDQTMASDVRIQGSGIRDEQCSGERRTPW